MKQIILKAVVIAIAASAVFSDVCAQQVGSRAAKTKDQPKDQEVIRDFRTIIRSRIGDNNMPIASDFEKTFKTESNKRDFKLLREYLATKEEKRRVLKMAADEFYYGQSIKSLFSIDDLRNLESEIRGRKPGDKIFLRLSSVKPSFNISGEYAAEYVSDSILPLIKNRIEEARLNDSLDNQDFHRVLQSIDSLSKDIFMAEQAIAEAIAPEYTRQDFRKWISLTFAGLIAALVISFFWIILRRSDVTLAKQLLSGAGLQFITVFILIIAIILFGIMEVLGGSELAAILSGISGYVLGKGSAGILSANREIQKTPAEDYASAEAETLSDAPETLAENAGNGEGRRHV
jgi:hypothetical protein